MSQSEMNLSTGFRAIINNRTNYFSKIFWAIAFMTSAIGLLIPTIGVFRKFNSEPEFGIKVSQKPLKNLPYPAITICSPVFAKDNDVNYRKAGKFFDMTGKNLTTQQKNYFAANYQVCNPTDELGDYEMVTGFLHNRTDFNVPKLVRESSLKIDDLMLMCGINGVPFVCNKHFTRVFTNRGFCFTFNMQDNDIVYSDIVSDWFKARNARKSVNASAVWTLDKSYPKNFNDDDIPRRATKQNRVIFLLNLKEEIAENFCPTVGKVFTAILHMPDEIPNMFHNEYFIPYNHAKAFILTATSYRANKEIRKYSPNVRDCYFQDERQLKFFKVYTKSQCDFECLTNYTLKWCGCVKFSMPHEQNTPICDLLQMKCLVEAIDRWPEGNEENHVACNCLQTCNDIIYGFKFAKESRIDYVKDFLGISLRPEK
jgi:amiloride-sensitive sodium channel